jgi:hypothetical protein
LYHRSGGCVAITNGCMGAKKRFKVFVFGELENEVRAASELRDQCHRVQAYHRK